MMQLSISIRSCVDLSVSLSKGPLVCPYIDLSVPFNFYVRKLPNYMINNVTMIKEEVVASDVAVHVL